VPRASVLRSAAMPRQTCRFVIVQLLDLVTVSCDNPAIWCPSVFKTAWLEPLVPPHTAIENVRTSLFVCLSARHPRPLVLWHMLALNGHRRGTVDGTQGYLPKGHEWVLNGDTQLRGAHFVDHNRARRVGRRRD
jgi:hypothetical protein